LAELGVLFFDRRVTRHLHRVGVPFLFAGAAIRLLESLNELDHAHDGERGDLRHVRVVYSARNVTMRVHIHGWRNAIEGTDESIKRPWCSRDGGHYEQSTPVVRGALARLAAAVGARRRDEHAAVAATRRSPDRQPLVMSAKWRHRRGARSRLSEAP